MQAVKTGYMSMKDMSDINAKILWAIIHGHHSAVRVLFHAISYTCSLELKSTYLCIACGDANATVNIKVVRELLSSVDVNGRGNVMRETPLHIASKVCNIFLLLLH